MYHMPLLKIVLDVSEAARMPLVPCRNAICEMQIAQVNNVQGCALFTVPAGIFCALLAVSERTGMSVMISSSEICVMHKSRR